MHPNINTNDTIEATVESLMRAAYVLDAEAAKTNCSVKAERLAADRMQLLATARALESRLDDGGTFNSALWEASALRGYVERELLVAG